MNLLICALVFSTISLAGISKESEVIEGCVIGFTVVMKDLKPSSRLDNAFYESANKNCSHIVTDLSSRKSSDELVDINKHPSSYGCGLGAAIMLKDIIGRAEYMKLGKDQNAFLAKINKYCGSI
jgi:hypothetical protein